MSTLEIVLIVIVVLVVALAVGGSIAQRRRMERNADVFDATLREVNEDLALAHAEDRGWHRDALEAAAREALTGRPPEVADAELFLTRIVDRPGTDDDKAIFRVGAGGPELTLGRRDGAWVLETLE